jgi:segregation and condensation protein A
MESALQTRASGIEQVDTDVFTGYPVKIEIFEGPVDLLVHLVRREQLDVSEVALAQITGQYLEYLQAMQVINIEVAGQFIVTAAALLQLKSRRLLPALVAEEPDEDEDDDTLTLVDQMRQRIAQYRVFRDAAVMLEESRQLRRSIYVRAQVAGQLPSGFVRLEDVSIFDLVGAVRDLLTEATPESPEAVERPAVTVAERLEDIVFQLGAATDRMVSFAELVGVPITRQIIIVTFLAVLELIRRRWVVVNQAGPRREILIRLQDEHRLGAGQGGPTG